jgi:hypothetical protein
MLTTILLWSSLILPWFSLLLLDKNTIKRYFPVAIFTALLVTIVFEMAYLLQWWELLVSIVPWGSITNVPFVYGMFFIGTIWIFHFTYGRFWLYLLTNLVIDAMQIFIFSRYMFQGWLYRLVNITELQVYILMVSISVMIYGYQMWQERLFTDNMFSGKKDGPFELELRSPWKRKEKIR